MAWNMPSKNNDYRNKIDMIRRPEVNRMSRTKTRTEWRKRGGNTTPTGKRRKNAFDGAYVAEVRRQVQSGFQVAGTFLKHLHKFVIDMDLTSLYPTIMLILNLSPKTMVAKMFFAKTYKVPMYPYIKFIDREEEKDYKANSNDFVMECYQGKHWWSIFENFCGIPPTEEILGLVESRIKDLK